MASVADIIFRADAAPHMGSGHVMRCMALAKWAIGKGIRVCLAGRIKIPWVRERLEREHIPFEQLPGEIPAQEKPQILLRDLGRISHGAWVVLDGYHFNANCQRAARAAIGDGLFVIDDYAHLREYSCDMLLNQNINAAKLPYGGEAGRKLLGPKYALLRPEFAAAHKKH